jgi:serine/threonine-protein phosphatase Stp1
VSGIRLRAAGLSDAGLVRAANEDSLVLRDDAALWAVADGMGGLQHGKRASSELATALQSVQLGRNFHLDLEAITATIEQANYRILLAAEEAKAQMGTTVAVLHIFESTFAAVWVGDSRIYLSRGGVLYRLSQDHTQVQEMVDAGLLREEEARHHPRSHVLSRAVGVESDVRIDAVRDTVRIHDTFLICSDGLTCVVDDVEIGEALNAHGPQSAAARLVELALARGAPDNVTVIVVRGEESTTRLAPGAQPHV